MMMRFKIRGMTAAASYMQHSIFSTINVGGLGCTRRIKFQGIRELVEGYEFQWTPRKRNTCPICQAIEGIAIG